MEECCPLPQCGQNGRRSSSQGTCAVLNRELPLLWATPFLQGYNIQDCSEGKEMYVVAGLFKGCLIPRLEEH